MKIVILSVIVLLCSNLVARDAYLGIYVEPPSRAELRNARLSFGVKIESVMPGSPAELSGLRANNIIFRIDNVSIRNENDLQRFMSIRSPGDVIHVHISQNEQHFVRQVQLTTWENLYRDLYIYNYIQNPWLFIGMNVEPITSSLARLLNLEMGMVVLDIREKSIAYVQGLEAGDIIISVNGSPTFNERTLTDALNMGLLNQPMQFFIWRNNVNKTLPIDLSNSLAEANSNSREIFIIGPDVFDSELYRYPREMINRLLNKPRSELESDIERLELEILRLRQRMGLNN